MKKVITDFISKEELLELRPCEIFKKIQELPDEICDEFTLRRWEGRLFTGQMCRFICDQIKKNGKVKLNCSTLFLFKKIIKVDINLNGFEKIETMEQIQDFPVFKRSYHTDHDIVSNSKFTQILYFNESWEERQKIKKERFPLITFSGPITSITLRENGQIYVSREINNNCISPYTFSVSIEDLPSIEGDSHLLNHVCDFDPMASGYPKKDGISSEVWKNYSVAQKIEYVCNILCYRFRNQNAPEWFIEQVNSGAWDNFSLDEIKEKYREEVKKEFAELQEFLKEHVVKFVQYETEEECCKNCFCSKGFEVDLLVSESGFNFAKEKLENNFPGLYKKVVEFKKEIEQLKEDYAKYQDNITDLIPLKLLEVLNEDEYSNLTDTLAARLKEDYFSKIRNSREQIIDLCFEALKNKQQIDKPKEDFRDSKYYKEY